VAAVTDLPASTMRELLRARMARYTNAVSRSLLAARKRAEAVELLAQEKRLGDDGKKVPLCESRLRQARAAEDEALDELGEAFTSAVRFVTGE
jgi:hypothetical protein